MALDLTALAIALFPAAARTAEKSTPLQLVATDPPPMADALATGGNGEKRRQSDVLDLVPSRDFEVTRDQAVEEFVAVMMHDFAGGGARFRHIARNYAQLANGAGWPPLSDKALSSAMQEWGCTTSTAKRQPDGSRPSILTFPNEVPAKPRKRRKARARRKS